MTKKTTRNPQNSRQTGSKTRKKAVFRRFFSFDIAIDLGTANTLISIVNRGVEINEPSVVAFNKKTQQLVAVGEEAKLMIGRTPKYIEAVRPIVDGVVSDYEKTEQMLNKYINRLYANNKSITRRPKIIMSLPSEVTEVEQRAVVEVAKSIGARKVYLINESVAAAIGLGLDIHSEKASMIVDIGGGTTEIAVVSSSHTVTAKSIRVAGDEVNEAIRRAVRDEFSLQIGERTSEDLKIGIGVVGGKTKSQSMKIRGRNVVSGLPHEIEVNSNFLKPIIIKQMQPIIDAVKSVLDEAPPEIISDIMDAGIYMAGGGSMIMGIDNLLRSETHISVNMPKNAITAVVEGASIALSDTRLYRRSLMYT